MERAAAPSLSNTAATTARSAPVRITSEDAFSPSSSPSADQRRFARPGLAGQKIQTGREFDHDIVDHRVIFESKFSQHKGPAIFSS